MDDQHKPEWIKVDEWDFVEYVDSLLRSQEAVDLEFKTACAGFPNSVWETYSSFANTDGGTIVLGIKEKNIITDNKIWNSIYINGYYFLQVQ